MDDIDMKVPNGAPPPARPDPPAKPAPPTTRRKSVSFPEPAQPPHSLQDTPTTAKILARKPTPFNSDLAATIRESGFGSAVRREDRMKPDDEPNPNDSEDDFDLLGGEVCEEEEVGGEEAAMALQIGQGLNRPPHRAPANKSA